MIESIYYLLFNSFVSFDFICTVLAEATSYDVPRPRSAELHDPAILNNDTEHFCRLETAQVKLVTYRVIVERAKIEPFITVNLSCTTLTVVQE